MPSGTGPDTPTDTPETKVSAGTSLPEAAETDVSAEESGPWSETLARDFIGDFHARRQNITCRTWVAAVRERGGQISSEHVSALYRLAREPEVPDPTDTAD